MEDTEVSRGEELCQDASTEVQGKKDDNLNLGDDSEDKAKRIVCHILETKASCL